MSSYSQHLTSWTMANIAILASGLAVACLAWSNLHRRRRKPPGPKGAPVIGNLLDLPTEQQSLTYTEWGKLYGPIVYAEALGSPILILNNYEVACDLLDKRAPIYSCRPLSHMINERMGWSFLTSRVHFGERLRKHRTLFQKYLQPSSVKNYTQMQSLCAYRLLGHLLETPEKFMQHIRACGGATIMMFAYGHEVAFESDRYISLSDSALRWLSKAAVPGNYLVDFFPFLRYIPEGFPGTKWKAEGRTAYKLSQAMLHVPYQEARQKFVEGVAVPSLITKLLEEDLSKEEEEIAEEALATLYAAGSDTTVVAIQSALLAVVLLPDILRKAQAEIDHVVERGRLPSFNDRESLPYIEAILREALRWNPVLPIGIVHRLIADDIYGGYEFQSGTLVIPNQWGMLHDAETYPDPFTFKPERWLDSDGQLLDDTKAPLHPNKIAFGFGRRICPGRFFAENTMFIEIVTMFAVFDIQKALDDEGRPITPVVQYSSGSVSRPAPFKCSIKPRSELAKSLIFQAVETAKVESNHPGKF